MQCPKCNYIRTHDDTTPRWQCPGCGVAYDKVKKSEAPKPYAETVEYQVVESAGQELGRKHRRRKFFRNLRILALLLILFFVAMEQLLTQVRSTSWEHPLWVVVYPINASGSQQVDDYIHTLSDASFADVEQFLVDEVARYELPIADPVDVRIGPVVKALPPLPPDTGRMLDIMVWSLKMRYWSYMEDSYDGPKPSIQIFVLYHDPEPNKTLQHSAALQKGMVSVVHAFATEERQGKNNVVIAHEMLHTLGATDKYTFEDSRPIYPYGYAEPNKVPLYPQQLAEIMGGRIPLSETDWEMPDNLQRTLVGPQTAKEIGWLNLIAPQE